MSYEPQEGLLFYINKRSLHIEHGWFKRLIFWCFTTEIPPGELILREDSQPVKTESIRSIPVNGWFILSGLSNRMFIS